jgi:membrane-associated phospholipid phosphatase
VRRWRLVAVHPGGWWFDLVLLAGFAALTVALARGHLLGVDQAVADWADAHRPTWSYWVARVFNHLGNGGSVLMPIAILLAGAVAWRRRSVRPLVLFAVTFVLLYATVGPLKILFDRAAPRFAADNRTVLFNELASGDKALSYPSGHVANSLVWYAAIALLAAALLRELDRPPLSRAALLAIRVLPVAIVFCTTTYLSWHWLTDSIAGLLLGLPLARLLTRIPWDEIPLPSRWAR